jgi:nucleoside-diphosphate-sugar epimerase
VTTALVTGAAGILGRLIVGRLTDDGVEVRAFVRPHSADDALPASVTLVRGDIRDRDAVRRATDGTDVVFHLASIVHAAGEMARSLSDYVGVNVEGTKNVAAAVSELGSRLVFFSTINVYGPTGGQMADETTECRPLGAYASTKREAELVVQQLEGRASILRLAAVYGRSKKGNYARLVGAIRRRRFARIGPDTTRKTVVHETDVVRAAMLAAFAPAAGGEIYNVTDGATHTMDEIIDAIADAAGVSPPRLRIPATAARLAARLADGVARPFGWRGGALSAVEKVLEDVAVSGERIESRLGFRPSVDLWDGWRMTLRENVERSNVDRDR